MAYDPYFDYERDYPLGDPRRVLSAARYDDEDEAEAQGAAAGATAAPPTAAPAFPARSSLASLLPQPDPEMDSRWRVAEERALNLAGQGGSYGIAEGIRDFAPMAIGGILDILVNKGRGLGTLAAGGMHAIASQQGHRDERQKEAAKQALMMRQQRESGADRAIQAQHAMLRGAELEQRIAEMQARDPHLSPEEAKQKALAEIALLKAQANKAQADADWAGMDDIIRILQTGTADQRAEALMKLKEREQELKERKLAADEERNRLEREGREREDAEKAETRRKETLAKQTREFNKDTEDVQSQARVLARIEPLLIKYGNRDRPGLGPVDSRAGTWMAPLLGGNTEDAVAFDQARHSLFTHYSHMVTGAASPEQERKFNQIAYGLRDGATEEEVTAGLNAAREDIRSTIRGLGAEREEAAQAALRQAGLYDFVYGPDVKYGARPRTPGLVLPAEAGGAPPSGAQPSKPSSPPPTQTTSPPSAAEPEPGPPPPGRLFRPEDDIEASKLWRMLDEQYRPEVTKKLRSMPQWQRLAYLRSVATGTPYEPPAQPQSGRPRSSAPSTSPPPDMEITVDEAEGRGQNPLGGIPGVKPKAKPKARRR